MIIFEVSSLNIYCYSIKIKLIFAKKKNEARLRNQEADEEPIPTALEAGELTAECEVGC